MNDNGVSREATGLAKPVGLRENKISRLIDFYIQPFKVALWNLLNDVEISL